MKFEYKTKLSYTDFISPFIGVFFIYFAFTDNTGIYDLPYPASSYFSVLIGVLMLIPLIFSYIKSRKIHIIELKTTELSYTKGTFITRNIKIEYKNIKGISYEDDKEEGSSIILDTGKIFDTKFYVKKFKSNSEYIKFCNEITKIIEK